MLKQEAFEKCCAHSPLRAAARRCQQQQQRRRRQRQRVTEGTAIEWAQYNKIYKSFAFCR